MSGFLREAKSRRHFPCKGKLARRKAQYNARRSHRCV